MLLQSIRKIGHRAYSQAFVADGAQVHDSVRLSHGVTIESRVKIKQNVMLHRYAQVLGDTTIGQNTAIHSFACVGGPPQTKKSSTSTRTIIGSDCVIREHVTIHAGSVEDTVLGNGVWLLAGSHVGHDSTIGDNVVVSNGSQIAGHVRIGNDTVLGGLVALQQFCVVGRGAMIGGGSIVDRHIPPFSLIVGNRCRFRGINIRGLRRKGVPNAQIFPLLKTSRVLFPRNGGSDHRNIVEHAKMLARSMDRNENNTLAIEFLNFIAHSGEVTTDWCPRRAALGIVQA